MGGQACVFYGAAEFSRDLDLLILVDPDNLNRIRAALDDLLAAPIAVPVSRPPLDPVLLDRGHAFHFRCQRADVKGLRIDLMANLRGSPPFEELWQRRTTIEADGEIYHLLARADLVVAKQTQRDKDWPMVARLVEGAYFGAGDSPSAKDISFFLRELRTPDILIELVSRFPSAAQEFAPHRPAIQAALSGDMEQVSHALRSEQEEAIHRDRLYWEPLKRELEQFRHQR
jgi:hypothetical protein